VCGACGKEGALYACDGCRGGGCREVVYCDRACCKASWKRANKKECGDLAKAFFSNFLALAQRGNAVEMFNSGLAYEQGRGVSQDWAQAVRWYEKAAAAGHSAAQTRLGECYAEGTGVVQDWVQAMRCWEKAATADVAFAQRRLGFCYAEGTGVAQDWVQAVGWLWGDCMEKRCTRYYTLLVA
jgi:TPR repeat protein